MFRSFNKMVAGITLSVVCISIVITIVMFLHSGPVAASTTMLVSVLVMVVTKWLGEYLLAKRARMEAVWSLPGYRQAYQQLLNASRGKHGELYHNSERGCYVGFIWQGRYLNIRHVIADAGNWQDGPLTETNYQLAESTHNEVLGVIRFTRRMWRTANGRSREQALYNRVTVLLDLGTGKATATESELARLLRDIEGSIRVVPG